MTTVSELTKHFIFHCIHEKKLSEKTRKCYEGDLSQFLHFLISQNHSLQIEKIDKVILRSYLQNLFNYKHKTIKRKIATLKALFNFLEFEDIIVVNPFRKLRFQLKEPKRLPTVMTTPEVQKLFEKVYSLETKKNLSTLYRKFEAARNIAVVELLFATGVRVSELSNLGVENIDMQVGFIRVVGKGNKERIIQICNPETLRVITEYAKLAKNYRDTATNCFFVNRLGRQLSEQSIRNVVKNLSKSAELTKRITPHVFRHSLATLLLEEGVDIKYIQEILGHSSITTTQIYTHVNKEKQKAILTHNHPRRNFSMVFDR